MHRMVFGVLGWLPGNLYLEDHSEADWGFLRSYMYGALCTT